MIINLIIKHLLPTAPALSLFRAPAGPHHREREREVESERGREGHRRSQREGLEEGEQQIRRGHHHIAGFFYTSKRLCFCVWWQTVCEVMWSQNKRKREEGTSRCWEGTERTHSKGPTPPYSPTSRQLITRAWLLFVHFTCFLPVFEEHCDDVWIQLRIFSLNHLHTLVKKEKELLSVSDTLFFFFFQFFFSTKDRVRAVRASAAVEGGSSAGPSTRQHAALSVKDSAADELVQRHHPKPIQQQRTVLQRLPAPLQQLPARLGKLHRLQW